MSEEAKTKLRKHAGALWILAVGITFILVYALCGVVLKMFGLSPAMIRTVGMTISALAANVTYIAIAFWGIINL